MRRRRPRPDSPSAPRDNCPPIPRGHPPIPRDHPPIPRDHRLRRGGAGAVTVRLGLGMLAGVGTLAGLGMLAGCGTSAASSPDAGQTCGTTRTGVNVPVIIKISKGPVSCATALRVENSYATAVRTGQVRGNGGGAPVTVSGWTCRGFPTPEVLKTGRTSACRSGGSEILAILPPPSAPAAPIASS